MRKHALPLALGFAASLLVAPTLAANQLSGPYEIVSATTGHCWKLDKEFISADASRDKRPAFYFEPLDATTAEGLRYYRIRTWHGMLHADVRGDHRLSTRAVREDDYTRFLVTQQSQPGTYHITVRAAGRTDSAPRDYLVGDVGGKITVSSQPRSDTQQLDQWKVRLIKLPWTQMPRGDYTAAMDYLNRVRANPAAHSLNNALREEDLPNGQESEDVIGVDLREVEARHPFRWNETLHQVALIKAELIARGSQARGKKIGSRHRLTAEHLANTGWESKAMRSEEDEMRELGYEPSRHNENLKGMGRSDPGIKNVGTMAVKALINDFGTDPPGHRFSLLGIGPYHADCVDFGMAIVKYHLDDRWRYRTVIIVGKQQ